uniref:transposase n=1 Tax=Pseudomonas lactis TaxID=1615674 RepID=UPI003969CDF3
MIDLVRVDEANRLRHDKPARKVIKEARWLLLRNPQNWKTPKQQVRLEDLLAANQALMTVYLMKAELKTLWTPSTARGWRSALKQWLRHAHESEIPALVQFAKWLKGYWRGLVSRVRWPMHTVQLEGINNRIKVIKQMAYGYRDSEFFCMKIKSVFPGNP